MKLRLFKQNLLKNKTQRAKLAVSCLVLVGLLYSAITPQTVSAENSSILEKLVDLVTEEAPSFPIAENAEFKQINVVSTAYTSRAAETDDTPCIPAMWKFNLCEFYEENGYGNSIAANFLPLGTQVRFPELYGEKIFVVRDRMNARYGYGRVDIWMPELAEAKTFGVKRLKMEVLKHGWYLKDK